MGQAHICTACKLVVFKSHMFVVPKVQLCEGLTLWLTRNIESAHGPKSAKTVSEPVAGPAEEFQTAGHKFDPMGWPTKMLQTEPRYDLQPRALFSYLPCTYVLLSC